MSFPPLLFFRKQFLVWEMFFLPLFPSFTENQVMDCYRAQINLREKGGGGAQAQKVFLSFFRPIRHFSHNAFYSLTQKMKKGNFFLHFCGRQSGRERGKKTIYDMTAATAAARANVNGSFCTAWYGIHTNKTFPSKKTCSFFLKKNLFLCIVS